MWLRKVAGFFKRKKQNQGDNGRLKRPLTKMETIYHKRKSHERKRLYHNIAFGIIFSILIFVVFPISLSKWRGQRDSNRCCLQKAREDFRTHKLNVTPWEACDKDSDKMNPQVKATKRWCNDNCPGFQPSSFDQWSDLMFTFLAPAVTLLILCPVGSAGIMDDDDEDEIDREIAYEADTWTPRWTFDPPKLYGAVATKEDLDVKENEAKPNKTELPAMRKRGLAEFSYMVQEYINIVGDPASALAGSFFQLWWDRKLVKMLEDPKSIAHGDAIRVALIAGQTNMERLYSKAEDTDFDMTEEDAQLFSDIIKNAVQKEARASGTWTKRQSTAESQSGPPRHLEVGQNVSDDAHQVPDREDAGINPTESINDAESNPQPPRRSWTECSHKPTDSGKCMVCLQSSDDMKEFDPLEESKSFQETISFEEVYPESKLRARLDNTIRMLLKAKTDFTNGIIVPVVFVYAGSAAAFYNAYKYLGDRDKAHSLAFGVMYAWLLILAVVSNSYAVTVNSGLLESAIINIMHGNHHHHQQHSDEFYAQNPQLHRQVYPRVVPFRKRIYTATIWSQWVEQVSKNKWTSGLQEDDKVQRIDGRFWLKYAWAQFLGWLLLAFFGAAATLIVYYTPIVGLGCRSLAFLLYTGLAFVVCMLNTARGHVAQVKEKRKRRVSLFRYGYGFLTFINAFILIAATMFDMIGLFRNCACDSLFERPDAESILLSSNTAIESDAARKHWFAVGYLAFIVAWIVTGIAICLREWIYIHLSGRFYNLEE